MAEDASTTPERAGRAGDQPLPLAGLGGDILLELVQLLEARRAVGLRRYGKPLQPFNGRDAPRDLTEELLDGAAYARQVSSELAALEAAVLALARQVRGDLVATQELEAALLVGRAIERKQARTAAAEGSAP